MIKILEKVKGRCMLTMRSIIHMVRERLICFRNEQQTSLEKSVKGRENRN